MPKRDPKRSSRTKPKRENNKVAKRNFRIDWLEIIIFAFMSVIIIGFLRLVYLIS